MAKGILFGEGAKFNDDPFVRDKKGKALGVRTYDVKEYEESPEEIARRQARHSLNRERDYINNRQRAYPAFGEFADMMWHRISEGVARGETFSAEEMAWYEKCKAIKDAFPKTVK